MSGTLSNENGRTQSKKIETFRKFSLFPGPGTLTALLLMQMLTSHGNTDELPREVETGYDKLAVFCSPKPSLMDWRYERGEFFIEAGKSCAMHSPVNKVYMIVCGGISALPRYQNFEN